MNPTVALFLGFVCCTTLAAAEIQRDIEYGRAGDERLLLDASVPEGTGPFPIAILVHGGGWGSGDKRGSNQPGNTADISPWFAPLTAAKFTWFSINYRLAPQHRWPAGFEDVETAIRWVKAHAGEFKGDPKRIVLFGHSAGGHLVCFSATRNSPETRVQAVVGFAPVTDFEQDLAARGGLSLALQNLLGRPQEVTAESRQILHELSPINHVQRGLPPFLLVHGEGDKSVPLQQSLNFQAKLRAADVPCELLLIQGGGHSIVAWEKIDQDYQRAMMAWLQRALETAAERARLEQTSPAR